MNISKNFTIEEVMCKCCHEYIIRSKLLSAVQNLRDNIDTPIIVTSWYRCPNHNKKIGGEPQSLHMEGKACDLVVPDLGLVELYNQIEAIPWLNDGGIGFYPQKNFIHVDIGRKKRWGMIDGKYVNVEEAMEYYNERGI